MEEKKSLEDEILLDCNSSLQPQEMDLGENCDNCESLHGQNKRLREKLTEANE